MGAGHTHTHEAHADNKKRLALVLGLVVLYMIAEVIGGILTNSLALLADAGHMLSDAAALALSLFALWIAQRPAKPRYTYGYYRTEILAALVNGATLVAIAIYIFIEAFERLGEPLEVQGALMFGIACGGLVINLLGLWILNAGKHENLNMHGAWLHVLTDALGSIGAIGAGAVIWAFNWTWADPVASAIIGVFVIYSAWNLLKEATSVLLEGAPGNIDVDAVHSALQTLPKVERVHDLHIWTISSGLVALSAHLIIQDGSDTQTVLNQANKLLHTDFAIDHATLQVEEYCYAGAKLAV